MNASDYIQAGTLFVGVVSFGAMMLNRYAVANHNDRLARITSAAGNVAGTIRGTLNKLPPGADLATAEAALVSAAVPPLMAEFDTTVAKLGATPEVVHGIIAGQLGKIPAAVVAPVVTALEPMVLGATVPTVVDTAHAAAALITALSSDDHSVSPALHDAGSAILTSLAAPAAA